MNKYKKLLNNSLIFVIGSFGSKLINFFMVPLYTNVLTTSEYGTVDLTIITISLLIPFLTFALGHAALRFTIETKNTNEKEAIFSNITIHGLGVSLLILLCFPLVYKYSLFDQLGGYFVVLLILNVFNDLYSQYIRGIGLVKSFAINGILMTLVTVSCNIMFLVVFNTGIKGYILSLIFASLSSNVFLLLSIKTAINIKPSTPNFALFKKMLKFSAPMIPNTVMWWLINSSTRYFVLFFVGVVGNGLFAVANKIPSLISLFTNIFIQAWQLSSFEEYESEDNESFYSGTFEIYFVFLFTIGSAILVVLKPALSILIDSDFYLSWKSVPLLILAVIYQSFSGFLGTIYTASKKTKGTFTSSIYGGIISVICSILFIPIFGIVGASLSTSLSFIGMFIIRLYDTRKYLKVDINYPKFLYTNILFIIQILLLFNFDGLILFLFESVIFISVLILNKNLILNLMKQIWQSLIINKRK